MNFGWPYLLNGWSDLLRVSFYGRVFGDIGASYINKTQSPKYNTFQRAGFFSGERGLLIAICFHIPYIFDVFVICYFCMHICNTVVQYSNTGCSKKLHFVQYTVFFFLLSNLTNKFPGNNRGPEYITWWDSCAKQALLKNYLKIDNVGVCCSRFCQVVL